MMNKETNPIYVTFHLKTTYLGYGTSKAYRAIDCDGDLKLANNICTELHRYNDYHYIRIRQTPLLKKYTTIYDGRKFFNPNSVWGSEFIEKK